MLRFYNAEILAMENDLILRKGELWTKGDRITYMGETPAVLPNFDREIDLQGKLLMPSFKNAHAHSAMTFLRSFAEDVPLQQWLFEKVFPYEERLTPDDVYVFTKLAIAEYLSSGFTAAFDMYLEPEAIVQAGIACGFRTVLCSGISGDAVEIDRLQRMYEQFCSYHPLVQYRLGFHSEYTTTPALRREIAKLAQAEKQPVYTHISETKKEHDECIARNGCTPAQHFAELGLWEYGGGGFHGVWLDAADRQIFADKGLYLVSCPASNAKLASGIAPLQECLAQGVHLALGTDGPASNNAVDPFREMYLAATLQRLRCNDAAAVPATEILKAATVGSAKAMGLHDCDMLAIGKQADFIVVDTAMPNLRPIHDVVRNLVYSGGKQNIAMTICAGKILYENGSYCMGLDMEKLYAEAQQRAERLTKD